MAAAISYYVLFSIVPLTIFTVSIFGLMVRDRDLQEDVADEIVSFLNVEPGSPVLEAKKRPIEQIYGSQALDEITRALAALPDADREELAAKLEAGDAITVAGRTLTSGEVAVRSDNAVIDTLRGVTNVSAPLTLLGLAGMAWAGSAMFGAIRKSLNIAWNVESHRPVVQQKLIDLAMVLGLGLLLLASIAGTGALRAVRSLSNENLGPLSEGTGFFWSVAPFILPAVITFVVFLLVYRYVPNTRATLHDVWPGAALATALFELLKNLFAIYIANFNNYDVAYGALGGILLFMLWTYLTATILLLGAEMAAEHPRVMRGDYAQTGPGTPLRETVLRTVRGLFVRHPEPSDEPPRKSESEADR